MQNWEYTAIEHTAATFVSLATRMNDLGRDGWEAFAVEPTNGFSVRRVWFKRQTGILPPPPAVKPFAKMKIAEN